MQDKQTQDRAVPGWTRPIRVPERVEILHSDPPVAYAGEKGTWTLPLRICEEVPAGCLLKFQVFGGRNNRLKFPGIQADRPGEDGYLTVRAPDGTAFPLEPDKQAGTFALGQVRYGFPARTVLAATLGDRSGGGGGAAAPSLRALDRFFVLYRAENPEDTPGYWSEDNCDRIVAVCTMHILGAETAQILAYAPSQAAPGEPFMVLARPQDRFDNLSHQPLENVELFLEGRKLDSRAEPVPGSTCLRIEVRLSDEGVHRVEAVDRRTGLRGVANPTICRSSPVATPFYWGMIHGHTELSDGAGTLEYYFRQMRDEVALDFAAPGDHDHVYETSDRVWGVTCEAVKRWNQPGAFTVLLGYEWAKWDRDGEGDRNVYYLHDDRPMYRSDPEHYPRPPDLFAALKDEETVVIPHHTAHGGNFCDWSEHDPAIERLVEIYQVRGSYECAEQEGNPLPERSGAQPVSVGYVRRALAMGWRVGFTGGGDDHIGLAGTDSTGAGQSHSYKAGLMSVLASECTRQAIWDALRSRRVVATSGPRMLLSYELNGHPMGSELAVAENPELADRRHLRIEFHGTAPAERVEVIRNGEVIHAYSPGTLDCELKWEDLTPLQAALLPPAKFSARPFCYYYVRAVQTDGEVAWASPIWIEPQ